jgi:hypothetical protein
MLQPPKATQSLSSLVVNFKLPHPHKERKTITGAGCCVKEAFGNNHLRKLSQRAGN